ncbi:MAG: hypothetical protein AAGA76_15985 [Pseudomonadota bacterium]
MNAVEIHEVAQQFYRAHGDKSEYEAAQKAQTLKAKGKHEEADDWQRVQKAISQLRGANYS